MFLQPRAKSFRHPMQVFRLLGRFSAGQVDSVRYHPQQYLDQIPLHCAQRVAAVVADAAESSAQSGLRQDYQEQRLERPEAIS
jgi:hypothetical protein